MQAVSRVHHLIRNSLVEATVSGGAGAAREFQVREIIRYAFSYVLLSEILGNLKVRRKSCLSKAKLRIAAKTEN